MSCSQKSLSSFTLLELLIVIAIIAVLAGAIIVVANPGELFKQTRDSDRINSLKQIANAINFGIVDTFSNLDLDGPFHSNTCKGETNQTIYLSLIDSTTTCANLISQGTLPSPPTGWKYHCSTSTSQAQKIDGSGWLPINFSQLSTLNFSHLPLDPKNQPQEGHYFVYVCDNSSKTFVLNSVLESLKYQNKVALKDGGVSDNGFEVDSNLRLTPLIFPNNWIKVPGNPEYNTSDFWVMKYEAKYDKDGVGGGDDAGACRYNSNYNTWDWNKTGTDCPTSWASSSVVSSPIGSPIAGISHTEALTACPPGSHLITNDEWMTIARNVEQIDRNWSGGKVGSGCLFRGNTGETSDCGYNGANPETGGEGRNPKAKLYLSNNQAIWDLAGNVWEHVRKDTNDTLIDNLPSDGGSAAWRWIEHTSIVDYGDLSYKEIRPSNSNWNSTQGMGRVYTYNGTYNDRVLVRGGLWSNGSSAGAFALGLNCYPGTQCYPAGFRCAR